MEEDYILKAELDSNFVMELSHNGDVVDILIGLLLLIAGIKASLKDIYNEKLAQKVIMILSEHIKNDDSMKRISTYYSTQQEDERIVVDNELIQFLKNIGNIEN